MIKVIDVNPTIGRDELNDRIVSYGVLNWSHVDNLVITGRRSDLEALGLPVGELLSVGDSFHSTVLEVAVSGSETYQFYAKNQWETLKAAGLLAEQSRYDCLILASTRVLARFSVTGLLERPMQNQAEFYADLTQAEVIDH